MSADVDVELDVVDRNNKPPVWDANVYGPIHIKENVTVGTVVTSLKARFVCHDMTETRHVTCRAVPCSAAFPTSVYLLLFFILFIPTSPPPLPSLGSSSLDIEYPVFIHRTYRFLPHSFFPSSNRLDFCAPNFSSDFDCLSTIRFLL